MFSRGILFSNGGHAVSRPRRAIKQESLASIEMTAARNHWRGASLFISPIAIRSIESIASEGRGDGPLGQSLFLAGCSEGEILMRWLLSWTLSVALVVCVTTQSDAADPAATVFKAATVGDAVKVIDLLKLPVMPGAVEPVNRRVSRISYNAAGDCKAAFEFHQQALLQQKWTELPDSSVNDQYSSGMFSKAGFTCSLTTTPLGPGMVNVMLMLHGNVDLKKLPLPKGSQVVYVGPQVAMFKCEESVEVATAECHKQLLAQGWLPYGQAGDSQFFRQNAVRINANIAAAPAQMGNTIISYSSEQLSAEIPTPGETVQLQYSDQTKEVLFDTKDTEAAMEKFYRDTLTKAGWKATTDQPFQIDWKHGLIFRNDAKEMLELEMYGVKEEKVLRVIVRHKSAAEVDAEEQAFQAALAKKKSKPMSKLDKIQVTLPTGAEITESTAKNIEFTVATGKGKSSVAAIRKTLAAADWKEKVTNDDGMIGVIDFEKGEQSISLRYVDPGFIPAEITINGSGVELEQVEKE